MNRRDLLALGLWLLSYAGLALINPKEVTHNIHFCTNFPEEEKIENQPTFPTQMDWIDRRREQSKI